MGSNARQVRRWPDGGHGTEAPRRRHPQGLANGSVIPMAPLHRALGPGTASSHVRRCRSARTWAGPVTRRPVFGGTGPKQGEAIGAPRAPGAVGLAAHARFDYGGRVDDEHSEASVSAVAGAMAEPARTRMLCRLLDGHARTSTELAIVAGVSPSTASTHLGILAARRLLKVSAQGRHRYYRLADAHVAAALEALTVVAGVPPAPFEPSTPDGLRSARTCYDHMAGALAVALHDRMFALRWLTNAPADGDAAYAVTESGRAGLARLGVEIEAARSRRRRFACGCLDWSERRPHLAGAVGAALLEATLRRRWVVRDRDSRALRVTRGGQRALRERFGISALA